MFNVKFCEIGEGEVWFEHVSAVWRTSKCFILETKGREIKLPRDKYQYLWRDDEVVNDEEWDGGVDWRGYGEEPEDIPEDEEV